VPLAKDDHRVGGEQSRDLGRILTSVCLWVPVTWIGAMLLLLWQHWVLVRAFVLSDTDDNMRMMQVRALLHGQGWFDLRQYRMDPPFGANIHWSRLVDLPIAGLILLLRPLVGGANAEQVAAALAPMLPMGLAILAIALIARRLIAPKALLIGLLFLACAHATIGMWVPMRIDHHGWQLAFLALTMLGVTDPDKRRGAVLAGLSSAASLTIGLEMLIYLAVAGAVMGLRWVRDGRGDALAAYGASLSGGCAAGFLLFASYANRAPVCDALSPVWMSTMVLAGGLCLALALLRLRGWPGRLALAALAIAILAGAFIWSWPQCLTGRLEGVSPLAEELWLSRVREARPIFVQSTNTIVTFVMLPIGGLIGYVVMLWHSRRDPERLIDWASLGALGAAGMGLLLWQTRMGPAAALLAVPGAAGLAWLVLITVYKSRYMLVRVLGTVLGFFLISGVGVQVATVQLLAHSQKDQAENNSPRSKAINRANARCPMMAYLKPVALQPKGYVLTFVDLGPRLITVTHHDAVAGPYHRNYPAIVDVMETFLGSADGAHTMVRRRHIDYVLICPSMSESTNYSVRAPNGFYAQLARGQVPAWLSPIKLPKDSPFIMWRVTG
jgi:hypothetical protein